MKSDMGVFVNILLGIVGAAIASAILSWFGIIMGGWSAISSRASSARVS